VGGIPVDVVRKSIKNLHLGVYPPNGRVRVAVPLRLNDDAVRLAVVTRLGWIRRQQSGFEKQERQSKREMVAGETHYVHGKRYQLSVIEGDGRTGTRVRPNARLEMRVPPKSSHAYRENVLNEWYRQLLREPIQELVAKWAPHVGVEVAEWGIRRMRTKWGSCNPRARRIWFNLELAKKSGSGIEFIVVHEMVHLLERHHNANFVGHMDRLLPNWRLSRAELNRAPLGHENWRY